MSQKFVIAASEFIAFMLIVTLAELILPWEILVLFTINSIAGTIISDLQISKAVVPLNSEIQNNRISLAWGVQKILRNNLWWR